MNTIEIIYISIIAILLIIIILQSIVSSLNKQHIKVLDNIIFLLKEKDKKAEEIMKIDNHIIETQKEAIEFFKIEIR